MELFRIGAWGLRLYSLMIVLGLLAGTWLATREAKRRSEDPDHVINAMILSLPLAFIGARLYHVISAWSFYQQNPHLILAIWRGGIGIYGAVVGAILGVAIYTRWKGLPLARWLDIGAPGLLLGQAIGRWGNFFNQELYGPPTDLPWGVYIAMENRLPGYEAFERFHPLFSYEFLWNLIGVAVLLYAARRFHGRLKDGDIALAYGIIYPLGRFMLENFRLDAWTILGFPTAQWVSLMAMIVCGAALLRRHPLTLGRTGLAWLGFLAGVAVFAIVALTVASLNLLPVLVVLAAIYILLGVVLLARLTSPLGMAAGRRRGSRRVKARRP